MSEQDTGNETTKQIYQLATEPVFATDQTLDRPDVTWEVSDGLPEPLPPFETESPQHEEPEESHLEEEKSEHEESDDDSEEEKEKIKKKNRISEKKRISDLNRQLKQAQAVAHDVLTRNQFLEKKLNEKHTEALTNEENLLSSQKERVKQYLTDALEEGDPAKIAEAHDLLSQYNAEIQLKKSQKTNFQNNPENYYPPQKPVEKESSYDDSQSEESHTWLENNNWANPNSDDFDEGLYEQADKYSLKLMSKYKLQGRKSEIGSSKFWDEISDYMNSTYEVSDNPSPIPKQQIKGRTPMKTDASTKVTSVSRQGTQANHGTLARRQDIALTPEQREAAHSLSGYVRDPKTGQKVTDNRILEEIYKRNLRV